LTTTFPKITCYGSSIGTSTSLFVRETLKASYSHTGRPSIDPEVLLRILLIGNLYGITSERRLVEDVGMHLAYRWFTGPASIKRFRTTLLSSRIGTAVFRNRRSFWTSSSESFSSAWKWDS